MSEPNLISIYQNGLNRLNLVSYHPMFKEDEIILNVLDDRIEVSLPTLDFRGKTRKVSSFGHGYARGVTITDYRLSPTVLYLNEHESTEDLLIFDFNF